MTITPTAIAAAQTALREAAREQKRLEFQHRKTARRLMQLADELALAALGIKFVLTAAPPPGTDNRKESQPS